MKKIILFGLLCFVIASCQKKNAPPAITTPTSTSTSASSSLVYGSLEVMQPHFYYNGVYTAYPNNVVYCFFSSTGIYSMNSMDNIPGGTITLNTVQLYHYTGPNNFAYQYHDTTLTLYNPPFNWNVAGSGIIPAFSVSINDAFPICNNTSLIPDTISISHGINVPISGAGADSVSLAICLNTDNAGGSKTKTFAITNNSVSFTAKEVSDFFAISAEKYRSIRLSYTKYTIQTFNGKKIAFKTTTYYDRNVTQTP